MFSGVHNIAAIPYQAVMAKVTENQPPTLVRASFIRNPPSIPKKKVKKTWARMTRITTGCLKVPMNIKREKIAHGSWNKPTAHSTLCIPPASAAAKNPEAGWSIIPYEKKKQE